MAELEESPRSTELTAARDGRVTIPAQLRRAAGLEPGSRLVMYVERGRVVIEDRDRLLVRVQREAIEAAASAGQRGGVVDELIADRRAAAARELDEHEPPTSTGRQGSAGGGR
jgi:AbrB family looped-hinge helix DNA binding protein